MYDGNAYNLGLENQSSVNYAVAVKNMAYDSANYARQVMEAKKSRTGEAMTSEEFLSGFSKDDKLIPVITIVVYFGAEPWDGPLSLHEMFEIQDEYILRYVPDYKINLIQPATIPDEEFPQFRTELGKVLRYIKLSGDKKALRKRVKDEA